MASLLTERTPMLFSFSLNNGSFDVPTTNIETFGNLRLILKKSLLILEGLWFSLFLSGLTTDHPFWCSGGVTWCFQDVLLHYGVFRVCSWFYRPPACLAGFKPIMGAVVLRKYIILT